MKNFVINNVNMIKEDFSQMINYVGSRAIALAEVEEGIAINTSSPSNEKDVHSSIVFFFEKWNNAYKLDYERKDILITWRE